MSSMDSQFHKVLILGAIAAASAFIVTILIVLVCVGCQRKSKSRHGQAAGTNHSRNMSVLRQTKLNSMSKSDTRLHELQRLPCNANGAPKNRPASMDLLLLHNRRSTSDLRLPPSIRQLPQIPTSPKAKGREHTYSEVGLLSSATPYCPDDGLYESVGVRGPPPDKATSPSAPPPTIDATENSAQSRTDSPVSNGNGQGVGGDTATGGLKEASQEVTAEYASVRKGRKLERWKRENSSEEADREVQSVSSTESPTGTIPRKTLEPFHMPNFPKEAVFMGNGEQYIWKPPEENSILMSGGPSLENGHSNTCKAEISEMYSTVCKNLKKKPQQQGLNQQANGQMGSTPSLRGEETSGGSRAWPPGGAVEEEAQDRRCTQEEHCYEAVGEKSWPRAELEPAYATLDSHWKRERPASNTLNPKKKSPGQTPGRALTCENFYETIGDLKQGASATSTTTIFTFNDGMEMYVTGL